jgi:arylsulfatase B
LGFLDDWVGEEGNNMKKYDLISMMDSDVNKAIGEIKSAELVIKLRDQAQISCPQSKVKYEKCAPFRKPCLFDISKDPCEKFNIYELHKEKVAHMEKILSDYREGMIPHGNVRVDSTANPIYHNNTWTNWKD